MCSVLHGGHLYAVVFRHLLSFFFKGSVPFNVLLCLSLVSVDTKECLCVGSSS